jgi:type III restriction enzyme
LEDTSGVFEVSYLARRIADFIDNAFIAYDFAIEIYSIFKQFKDKKKLDINSGFIIDEICKKIIKEKTKQEYEIFNGLIINKKLILAVSADKNIGYSVPNENEIYPEGIESYKLNLFEKSDALSMNPLEKKVANLIDNKDSVLWWVRNMAKDKKWYSVRGWQRGKIYPDFIVAKKRKNNSLELIYVLESKGEHLIGNPDTEYKKNVFDKINSENIKEIKFNLIKFELNKDFQFELVEQGKEELEINNFFNI